MSGDLATIRARAAAATPGPWVWRGNADYGDPYLAAFGKCGLQEVLGHVPVERTREDAALRSVGEVSDDPAVVERTIHDYLFDGYGDPRHDLRLCVCTDLLLRPVRDLLVYEVCPDAKERSDPRVYRADVIGIRHPDAEFIAHSRADVDALLAEVDRLSALVAAGVS